MDTDPVINNAIDRSTLNRFFKYVPVRQAGECWIWDGHTMKNGYGEFYYNGSPIYAHRMSYLIHFGEFPDFALVCHTCDVKRCVNPSHLYLGSHSQNLIDRYTRHPETKYWRQNKCR